MDYTISIGSNEQRRENMELARRRLTELFSGIRFSEEEETGSRKEARGEGAGNCTAGYRLVVL